MNYFESRPGELARGGHDGAGPVAAGREP
eukprot:COSAG01_NODE_5395_length_4290_cov_5.110475_5_plen_28_part_01